MPIYEYQCGGCGQITEIIQKFSDPPLTACAQCGGPVSKLMSRTSFQLKGSGWYATDYKKSPSSTASSAPSTEKKAETSCDAPGKPCGTKCSDVN